MVSARFFPKSCEILFKKLTIQDLIVKIFSQQDDCQEQKKFAKLLTKTCFGCIFADGN
jgi:hypothetical protein